MKVTRLVCDRCGDEMTQERAQARGLELKLRYEPAGGPGSMVEKLLPFRRTSKLDLCPDCRTALAKWLGDDGRELPGLSPEDAETTGSESGAS